MVQFLDRSPRYKKKIITRKDEVNLRAYVTYKSGATEFSEDIGDNRAEIDKVFETIHGINYTGEFLIDSIRMTATSSPEGSADMNLFPSKGVHWHSRNTLPFAAMTAKESIHFFRPRWIGEDWNRLHELVLADDSLENKAYLLTYHERDGQSG